MLPKFPTIHIFNCYYYNLSAYISFEYKLNNIMEWILAHVPHIVGSILFIVVVYLILEEMLGYKDFR